MHIDKEAGSMPEAPDPALLALRIEGEAGGDRAGYIERLRQRYADTPFDETLSGVAYLIGTNACVDPFEMYHERVASFDDGSRLGLRVAQEILGPDYIAVLGRAVSPCTVQDWRDFFQNGSSACQQAAADMRGIALEGLSVAEDYLRVAEPFAEAMPYLDPNDNLFMYGYAFMFSCTHRAKELALAGSAAAGKHSYKVFED